MFVIELINGRHKMAASEINRILDRDYSVVIACRRLYLEHESKIFIIGRETHSVQSGDFALAQQEVEAGIIKTYDLVIDNIINTDKFGDIKWNDNDIGLDEERIVWRMI